MWVTLQGATMLQAHPRPGLRAVNHLYHLSLFLWGHWRRGLERFTMLLWESPTALVMRPFSALPTVTSLRTEAHLATCAWLTSTYTRLILIVTDLSPLCPSTVLLAMSPLLYRCKVRSCVLQVYKFHSLSRWGKR